MSLVTPCGSSGFRSRSITVISIEGEDLTALPLLERKRPLLAIMPAVEWCQLLCLDRPAVN